jgi:septum formation protein
MTERRNNRGWILASASPRRKEILKGLGLRFMVDPSRISEPAREKHESPKEYAKRLACLKAAEVARRHASGLVIGVDTIVVAGNRIMGKPEGRSEAYAMLTKLSGRWHEVISGICLIDCGSSRAHSGFGCSRVHFKRLLDTEIEWYLETGEYHDKAGAYGIQGHAALLIDRIEGCYFNIVGFPIAVFERLCRKAGVNLFLKSQIATRKS